MKEIVCLGKWKKKTDITAMLHTASKIRSSGERIAFISEQFIGTPYKESTLIGGSGIAEELVINLGQMDCFTFLDYIEAMRVSGSFSEFYHNLIKVRYKNGIVQYQARNHFFTDWMFFNRQISDITGTLACGKTATVVKTLNQREDGSVHLDGIVPFERIISYISPDLFCPELFQSIQTGDYTGIYTDREGLDVSHVGIAVRKGSNLIFRHASSATGARKVLDEDFPIYTANKTGIIVFRAT